MLSEEVWSRECNPSLPIDCVYFLQSTHISCGTEVKTEVIVSHRVSNLLLERGRELGKEGVSEGEREGVRERGRE